MTVAEPRRTALMLIPLVDSLDEVDADADALLQGHGLDREKIRDFALRLPSSTVWKLFREAEAMTADPTLGARAGLSIRQGVFDVFDYVVGSAATLADAWGSAAQLQGLLNDTHKRTLRIEGDRAVVEFNREPGEPDVFAEFAIASLGTFARQVTGQFLTADRVTFCRTVEDGGDVARFRALLGHDPEFGATVDAIEFPSSYFALPLRAADPGLHKILERHAEELLARLPRVQPLSAKVRDLIVGELRCGNPGLVCIAERLGMSARTLRRRLAEEGVTHQGLLDDLRRKLADRYLHEETLTVSQVAVLLGFSNPSAFHRAFRRWNGTSPDQHRRRR